MDSRSARSMMASGMGSPGAPVSAAQLLLTMGSVALGEAVACCVLGVILMKALKKLPPKILN